MLCALDTLIAVHSPWRSSPADHENIMIMLRQFYAIWLENGYPLQETMEVSVGGMCCGGVCDTAQPEYETLSLVHCGYRCVRSE